MSKTVEIDIDDFVTESDKRQIARDAFRQMCVATSQKDFERILSNAGYNMVKEEVDLVFDGEMATAVRNNAIKVINSLTAHTVFKKADAWDRDESKAWRHLQVAMDDLQPVIAQRVTEIIQGMTRDDLHELIQQQISVAIIDKLTAGPTP